MVAGQLTGAPDLARSAPLISKRQFEHQNYRRTGYTPTDGSSASMLVSRASSPRAVSRFAVPRTALFD
jgi:hypothetical protein